MESQRRAALITAFAWGVLVMPCSIVLHETGHAVALLMTGHGVAGFSYDGVSHGLPPEIAQPWHPDFVVAFAPTLALLPALVGVVLAWLERVPSLAIALAVSCLPEPVVSFAGVPSEFGAWTRVLGWGQGRMVLVVLFAVVSFALVVATVSLLRRANVRSVYGRLKASVAGILVGFVLWMFLIGPLVLPCRSRSHG